MAYFSQEIIDEVRLQNNIIDVVSSYVPLKQRGSTYIGLCPFHNEKTPSFTVSADKQMYYCFGCGAGGNVFTFLSQMENCTFPEAVEKLAERVHIKLPAQNYSDEDKKRDMLKEKLLNIHTHAGRFYYDTLHLPEGKKALDYITNRKIKSNIQRKFGLGYSPESGYALCDFLLSKGYTKDEILKSGLAAQNKNGSGMHDKFVGRIMFPIFNVLGKVVGFGGRSMKKDGPKYLNSPETLIFNKSRNLYGLNFAKATKKHEIILVEGYMDMISIYQAGFFNVAASLGTAFNTQHARTLKRYFSEVILLYDSDEAGTNAALRAIPVLTAEGFKVKVLQVPDGKDPDEFIKHKGSMEFGKLLYNAENYITFQVNCIRKQYNMQNTEHKVIFTTEAAKILSKVENSIERDAYAKEISDYTGIAYDAVLNEISKILTGREKTFEEETRKKLIKQYSNNTLYQSPLFKGIIIAQKNLIYICIVNKSVWEKIKTVITPNEFLDDFYKTFCSIIYDMNSQDKNIFAGDIISLFESSEDQKRAAEIFSMNIKFENIKSLEKAVNEEIKIIKRQNIDKMISDAMDIKEIQNLLKYKKELDRLYISIADS